MLDVTDVKINDKYMYKDLGIIVEKITPEDVLAQRQIDKFTTPKIDGSLYYDYKTLSSYTLDMECVLPSLPNLKNLNNIKHVFSNREVEIILPRRSDVILEARLISKIDFSKLAAYALKFVLSFEVQPYAELLSGRSWIEAENEMKLINEGNTSSKPLIKVTGCSGTFEISINNKKMTFSNVNKTFIIDTDYEDVYGEDNENLNCFMDLSSDFVGFEEGENEIYFTGAEKVEIMPRWREL